MQGLPPLRSDLVIIDQTFDGVKSYIVKDPVKQSYSRFDEHEYYVLSLLDGKRSSRAIANMVNREFELDLTPKEVRQFVFRLEKDDLFERTPEQQNTFLYEQMREQRKSLVRQAKGSLLYFRIPLVDPNDFFNLAIPYLRWFFTPLATFFAFLFMTGALSILVANGEEVTLNLAHTFDFANQTAWGLLTLWVVVMVTIAIHELGHGLTCKHFGGECHEIGLLFMLMTPCMYCNVNDSWMFKEKRYRLFTVFAGCYVEILFGCAAVYLWWLTQPGSTINVLAFQCVLVTFFSTLLLNLNPLMKFDGYFALSDYLEVPNLKQSSKEHVSMLFNKWILRLEEEEPDISYRKHRILLTYGSLATVYMINMKLGMLFLAGSFLVGSLQLIGLLITAFIAYKLYGGTVNKQITLGKRVWQEHQSLFQKKQVRGGLLLAALLLPLALLFLPFSYKLTLPAELKPVRELLLRTVADGEVLPLNPDQREFQSGETILIQKSDHLDQRALDAQKELRSNRVRIQAALAKGAISEVAQLRRERQKLKDEAEIIADQKEGLKVAAPYAGVLAREIGALERKHLSAGAEIGRFLDTSAFEARVRLPEGESKPLSPGLPARLVLDAQPERIFLGEITKIAAEPISEGISRYYEVTVTFPNHEENLREGLHGTVYLDLGKKTVAQRAVDWMRKTVRLDLQLY